MAYKPFKMKGNPMQRNYGIGSPAKQGLILKDSEKGKEYEKNRNTKTVNIKDIKGLEPSTSPTRPKTTDMKKEKSPAKQGYRSPDLDYSDPEVLRKEKEGNQRIIDSRKDLNKNKKRAAKKSKKGAPSKWIGTAIKVVGKGLSGRAKSREARDAAKNQGVQQAMSRGSAVSKY